MNIPNIYNHLFLDLETVSGSKSYSDLPERMRLLWDKKAKVLRIEDQDPESFYFEKAGIYSEFGQIVAIGLGFFATDKNGASQFRAKVLKGDNEKGLLEAFATIVSEKFVHDNTILVAHNGKEFDFPYLSRRMLINEVPLPSCLDLSGKKPWEIPHVDTMEMWKFGDRKNFTSLDLLAAVFDIKSSKTGMDGSMVNHAYHKENALDRIAEYCLADVVVCAQVFLRLSGEPSIPDGNIIIVD